MTLTQDWLDAGLEFWKERLALQSWSIKARWAGPEELDDSYGDHRFDPLRRTGFIRVRTEPFRSNDNELWDPEHTIIHELLHLHLSLLCSVSKADLEETLEERFINDMASALLGLKKLAVEAIKYGKEERSNNGDAGKDRPVSRRKKVGKKSRRRGKGSGTKGSNAS